MPDTVVADIKPLSRTQMAARVARDIPEGWYVNLGIGIPTAVADHVPLEREVIFHSENGVLGMGPAPPKDKIDPWLINAGKQYVTLRDGGSFCHHADSFSMIRGGHLDLCVLARSRWRRTATSPTGPPARTTPHRRSAARWTWRPAPSGSGC